MGSHIGNSSRLDSRHSPLCQQPTRAFSSANPRERARDASIQIAAASSEIPGCPCGCLQSIQPGPTFDLGPALPIVQTACLCVLGMCNGGVTERLRERLTGSIANFSVPATDKVAARSTRVAAYESVSAPCVLSARGSAGCTEKQGIRVRWVNEFPAILCPVTLRKLWPGRRGAVVGNRLLRAVQAGRSNRFNRRHLKVSALRPRNDRHCGAGDGSGRRNRSLCCLLSSSKRKDKST